MIEWRKIKSRDKYSVSSTGLVRNDVTGKILTPVNSDGYLRYGFWDALKKRNVFEGAHRLVAKAFIQGEAETVNHINGVKSDNRVQNLEWLSKSENSSHGRRTGLIPDRLGESHGMAKLTEATVLQIRSRSVARESRTSLAKEYGVALSTISLIALNKTWKHI